MLHATASRTDRPTSKHSGFLWILLLIAAFIACYGCLSHTTASQTMSHSQKMTQSSSPHTNQGTGHSLYGKPSLTVGQINTILIAYHSPSGGHGQDLYTLSSLYGIDDAYPLAFFMHESSFGTVGMASVTHSLGNLRCIDGAACVNSQDGMCQAGQSCYASFPNWYAGFKAWFVLITSSLYKGDGLTTVETIIPRYAPSEDHNNEGAYIEALVQAVDAWQSGKVVF
jgi:hypothetical protein